jgi:hypothetical protein
MADALGPLPKPQFLARSLQPVEGDPTAGPHSSAAAAPATSLAAATSLPDIPTAAPDAASRHVPADTTPPRDPAGPAVAAALHTAAALATTEALAKAVPTGVAATESSAAAAGAGSQAAPPRALLTGGIDTAGPGAPAGPAPASPPACEPKLVQTAHAAPAADGAAPSIGPALEPATPHVTNVSAGTVKASAPGAAETVTHRPACGPMSVRVVNSKRFSLEYDVRDVGSAGVAGVELWYTQDGKTWHKHDSRLHHRSPYVIEVAEEDLYGFTLVAHSGSGLTGRLPRAGDLPQAWVEVDVTKPAVRLLGVQPGTGGEAGSLDVVWQATDKNLDPRPVTISYAEKDEGPWTPIAVRTENTGRYVWHTPAAMPARFLVRIEAVDRAGNVGVAQTPTPLAGDVTLPATSIRDIEPAH